MEAAPKPSAAAAALLRETEEDHPQAVELWRMLVLAYEKLGVPPDADRALERYAELEDDRGRRCASQGDSVVSNVGTSRRRGECSAAPRRRPLKTNGPASGEFSPLPSGARANWLRLTATSHEQRRRRPTIWK
jgi:hypothetical protein